MLLRALIFLGLKFWLILIGLWPFGNALKPRILLGSLACQLAASAFWILRTPAFGTVFAAIALFHLVGVATAFFRPRGEWYLIPSGDPGLNPLITFCFFLLAIYLVGFPFPQIFAAAGSPISFAGILKALGSANTLSPHSLIFFATIIVLSNPREGNPLFSTWTGASSIMIGVADVWIRPGESLVPEITYLVLGLICFVFARLQRRQLKKSSPNGSLLTPNNDLSDSDRRGS
ncbi:hypothetical protein KQI84_16210 [bacterium]|nr:hypothetical protein [bacterium]